MIDVTLDPEKVIMLRGPSIGGGNGTYPRACQHHVRLHVCATDIPQLCTQQILRFEVVVLGLQNTKLHRVGALPEYVVQFCLAAFAELPKQIRSLTNPYHAYVFR